MWRADFSMCGVEVGIRSSFCQPRGACPGQYARVICSGPSALWQMSCGMCLGPNINLGPLPGGSPGLLKRGHVFGDRGSIYDLDRLPRGRPRKAARDNALFTLTAHTRLTWCSEEGRALRRNELAAGQGLPSHPALACALGTQTLDFESYRRSRAAKMVPSFSGATDGRTRQRGRSPDTSRMDWRRASSME